MNIIRNVIIAAALWFAPDAFGQKPYWVTESNKWVKDKTIVRIYDGGHRQIAERQIERTVDINNREEVWKLNRMVRSVVRGQRQVADKPRRTVHVWAQKVRA
jgi:hypothetical protein